MSKPHWRPARTTDLPAISAIAARIHPDLPERPDVFAEKMLLYPDGCRVLVADDAIAGYGLAHPWRQHRIPPLDGFLERELLERVERVVVDEDADRPLGRQQMRRVQDLGLQPLQGEGKSLRRFGRVSMVVSVHRPRRG